MTALRSIYATVAVFVHDRAAKVKERAEHGQGSLEYMGLVIIVAIALVIALTAAREPLSNLATNFGNQIQQVLEATNGGG